MTVAELTQLAMIGTERQALPAPKTGPVLGNLLSQMDLAQKERTLLGSVALVFGHERTGHLPGRDTLPMPAVCPPETKRRVSNRAASLLYRLLSNEHASLLPEWLALARTRHQIAPPELLPGLLVLGTSKPGLREWILPSLGERGRWLAAQNADWSWVVGDANDDSIWETGDSQSRRTYFQRLRTEDPHRARDLLVRTWKEESPEDRAVWIQLFQICLSASDEPFLESALDDKRKEVRREAARLLSLIPNAAYLQRMIDRVKPLMRFVQGDSANILKLKRSKPATIDVTLPASFDKSMQRDGLELKPVGKIGEKAWWLKQMLERVPLSLWIDQWQVPAGDIMVASLQSEWKTELFEAWVNAARHQQNEEWANLLFLSALEMKRFDQFQPLLGTLSPAKREEHVGALLEANDPKVQDLHRDLVSLCQHAWSANFSRTFLRWLHRLTAKPSTDWTLRNQSSEFAKYLDPEALTEALKGWPTEEEPWASFWAKGMDDFFAVVQFRSTMHQAFAESTDL